MTRLCPVNPMRNRIVPRYSLLACCLLSFAAVAAGAAPANLTAEQIVEKNVAARGGLGAWRAVETLTLSGTMDAGGTQNHALPFVLKLKRPHKSRLEILFNNQTAVQVYDGAHGWKLRPFLNRNEVETYTDAEARSAAASDELDGALIDHAAKGTRIALLGSEAVEGHPAYKLVVTSRGGARRNVWIDESTFLEVKADGEPRKLNGQLHKVTIYYRDYRGEHGLQIARLQEIAVEGVKATEKTQITAVGVNERLDDALFQKPLPAAAPAAAAALKKS